MILSLVFLILWVLKIVNTDYDWLIFAVLCIADNIDWGFRGIRKELEK